MRRLALLIALCALPLGTRPAPALAQDAWVTQVRDLLQEAGKLFSERGYQATHDIHTGSLPDDGSESVSFELQSGREYAILGACDSDCSDLDLVLYDGSGKEVDNDLLEDDFPVVTVTPPGAGSYRVEIRMATCDVAPCRYGVGVYGN